MFFLYPEFTKMNLWKNSRPTGIMFQIFHKTSFINLHRLKLHRYNYVCKKHDKTSSPAFLVIFCKFNLVILNLIDNSLGKNVYF